MSHTLVSDTNFLLREREEFPTLQPAGAAGFNNGGIKFGDLLLDRQILAKMPYF